MRLFTRVIISPRRIVFPLLILISCSFWFLCSELQALSLERAAAPKIQEPLVVQSKEQIAIEYFILESNSAVSRNEANAYSGFIIKYANENNIDPFIIAGLMKVESRFDRYAISDSGAVGLTQILPKWHKEKIKTMIAKFGYFDFFNPEHSICLGAKILAEYKTIHGSKERALLQYNGSLAEINPSYAKAVIREANRAKNIKV